MGERKGTNLYYPPDYDPKKGGINKFLGTHPLRERARKLDQGILIIRFEMPFNIWCNGCGNHIGMGVRYNAEKKKIGNYYSTPIWNFRMKCHLCDNHFEIKTEPKTCEYIVVSGARRQENRWDAEENEQIVPEDKNVSKQLFDDAMFKLEHQNKDRNKARSSQSALSELEERQRNLWHDDFAANSMLRRKFRDETKDRKSNEAKYEINEEERANKKQKMIKDIYDKNKEKHIENLVQNSPSAAISKGIKRKSHDKSNDRKPSTSTKQQEPTPDLKKVTLVSSAYDSSTSDDSTE